MLIRIRSTGQTMYESEFRSINSNTSFPPQISVEILNEFGADPVLNGAQPVPSLYQIVVEQGVEQINGQWFTKFVAVEMSQEAKNAKDLQSKEANKKTAEGKLQATDWTQVADVPLLNKQAFVDYRAAVRAIALNPPVIVENWAVKPEEQWS
jgi:NACalpha-BTF3-like transcription factor